MKTASIPGCVVESFGRNVIVVTTAGARLNCRLRGRKLEVVAGDEVSIDSDTSTNEHTVTDRRPRRNVFERSDSRGMREALAANLDQLAVVVAPEPSWDPFIVDRYLAGARAAGIDALLVQTKGDLPSSDEDAALLRVYERILARVLRVSARSGAGVAELQDRLSGKRTLLVGQSGVGKSTLFNHLSGGAFRTTRELSTSSQEGRHTTVSSAIITLPWGELVDSPGVRDYAPPIVALREVQLGFAEIADARGGCRFLDCLHAREPDCAVLRALGTAEIDARRYESYRRLLNLTRQLEERRGHRT